MISDLYYNINDIRSHTIAKNISQTTFPCQVIEDRPTFGRLAGVLSFAECTCLEGLLMDVRSYCRRPHRKILQKSTSSHKDACAGTSVEVFS